MIHFTYNSKPVLFHCRSARRRSYFALFSSNENHGESERSVTCLVRSGACLSSARRQIVSKSPALMVLLIARNSSPDDLNSDLSAFVSQAFRFRDVTFFCSFVCLARSSSHTMNLWSLICLSTAVTERIKLFIAGPITKSRV